MRMTFSGKGSKSFTGAGDVVQAVAKATGIEAVVKTVEKVTGKDCGCNKRREALNKAIPFKEGSD